MKPTLFYKNEFFAKRLLFALYVLLVVYVSLTPSEPTVKLVGWDKIGHFLAYSGMTILASLTFRTLNGRFRTILLIIGLGFLLEWVQTYIPSRSTSWDDAFANNLGVLLGTAVFYFQQKPLTKLYDWIWSYILKKEPV